jgi:C1A family cysteine protease
MNKLKLALPRVAGLMLVCVVILVRTDAPNGDERTAQQVAEPKLVRPGDFWRRFEVPKPMGFDKYRREFNKQYVSESERLMRETIYRANQAKAFRSQMAFLIGSEDYFLGPTQFSDMTEKEIRDRICPRCDDDDEKEEEDGQSAGEQRVESKPGQWSEADSGKSVAADKGQAGLPLRASQATTRMDPGQSPSMDLVETGCLLPPKDQNGCAACYAFTVVAALEYLYCRTQTNQPVSFSEQFMIDCGDPVRHGIDGCEGGADIGAIQFSHEWGIFPDYMYPYQAVKQTCTTRRNEAPNVLGSPEYVVVPPDNWVGYIRAYMPIITITFIDTRDYPHYYRGIFSPRRQPNRDRPHSVLAVGFIQGYDQRRDESYYAFKMRNSWGTQWGENGYFFIRFSLDYLDDPGYVLPGFWGSESRPDAQIISRLELQQQQPRRGWRGQ